MKIVVLDGYCVNPGDLTWNRLKNMGDTVIYDRTECNDEIIIERIHNADAVYTNKTPISKKVIESAPRLKFIGVLATGYNVVDVDTAKSKNIIVSNIPTYGTDSVAQMAIALLLELCHHVGAHNNAVQVGKWEHNPDWCFWNYPLVELAGKTIGIVGYGRIGQAVGHIAQALGMKILAYDKASNNSIESETLKYVNMDELLKKSDVISLHCPLFSDTAGIINKKNINKMKDGVFIINNSRGGLVVESDLAEGLKSGKVGGAALDVVSTEPINHDNPLLGISNCIITPHISWAPKESRQRLLNMAIDNLETFLHGTPQNVVG